MVRYLRASKHLLITTAVLALMTLATAQARADGTQADLHYVAVGVSKVPSLPAENQLRFAHKDAQDLARTWDAQKGKLYANVQGELLTNENARRDDILAALDRLNERARKGDTVVVSFAGHGGPYVGRGRNNWFFVSHDYDRNNFDGTALTEGLVRDRLARIAERGVTVILVIDTCFSGLFDAGDSGVIVLAACGPQEFSLEDGRLENGLFTRALVEAVGGKARIGDGVITLEAIEEYVSQRVTQLVDENPAYDPSGVRVTQRPTFTRPAGMAQTALVGGMVQQPVTDAPQEQQRWRN